MTDAKTEQIEKLLKSKNGALDRLRRKNVKAGGNNNDN